MRGLKRGSKATSSSVSKSGTGNGVPAESPPADLQFSMPSEERAVEEDFRAVAGSTPRTAFEDFRQLVEEQRPYLAGAYEDAKKLAEREQEMKVEATAREVEARRLAADRDAKLRSFEAWVRFVLALFLILGTVLTLFYGLIRGLPASDLSQYLAPVSGLAGIAVGYFFGRESS